MELNALTFLIVCPLCFLAGVLNASAGSGGLISLPAFMIAGLPPHLAIGTNKLQAVMGMFAANVRFIRGGYLNYKLALPSILSAIIGSLVGSNLSLICNESVLSYLMLAILPFAAFFALNKKTFTNSHGSPSHESAQSVQLTHKTYLIVCVFAAIIGCYDGFYGPGTGTFLIIVFIASGNVLVLVGLAAGVCNIVGSWIGAGLVIDFGAKIMRPALVIALVLMLLKVLGLY